LNTIVEETVLGGIYDFCKQRLRLLSIECYVYIDLQCMPYRIACPTLWIIIIPPKAYYDFLLQPNSDRAYVVYHIFRGPSTILYYWQRACCPMEPIHWHGLRQCSRYVPILSTT